ncbi:hypothetical protein [Chryseobacterium sp. FH1]|uniref:hypothetical protein n=1 Tax=Chryseobacterium sp. FH1 TaxID=1233951 RepID=UPI0004E3A12A|nr:hypothetical protein [Chryseobacterium sp. FH1]KFC24710.1 hypothetical protein IO90_00960 [Chryseobacterium sp. FH1]
MGTVFGQIHLNNIISGYDYFKNYCLGNSIELTDDYPEDKLVATQTIKNLKVLNANGIEIKGLGNQISGMDSDNFEITLVGVSYPLFEEEFPNHVKAYNETFKKDY